MGNQHATALAWLAGIMDGEGSILILRYQKPTRIVYGYRVSVGNTDLSIINACQKIFGRLGATVRLYEQDRGKNGMRRKKTYTLHVGQRESIVSILRAIRPYLVGKLPQAKAMLKALSSWEKIDKSSVHAAFKIMNKRVPR